MGLDIKAYRGIKAIRDFDHVEDVPRYLVNFTKNDDAFPGRADEINPDKLYGFVAEFRFPAGSYSGYGDWRNALARLAGHSDASAVFADPRPGPFVELINFTDCDGTIGWTVAAKLAKDFADFDDRARAAVVDPNWFYDVYQDFRAAFELASRGGAVVFR